MIRRGLLALAILAFGCGPTDLPPPAVIACEHELDMCRDRGALQLSRDLSRDLGACAADLTDCTGRLVDSRQRMKDCLTAAAAWGLEPTGH